MGAAWIDKADNPGMAELGLDSGDVYGAIVTVNMADLVWRVALTSDFSAMHPVTNLGALTDLAWVPDP